MVDAEAEEANATAILNGKEAEGVVAAAQPLAASTTSEDFQEDLVKASCWEAAMSALPRLTQTEAAELALAFTREQREQNPGQPEYVVQKVTSLPEWEGAWVVAFNTLLGDGRIELIGPLVTVADDTGHCKWVWFDDGR